MSDKTPKIESRSHPRGIPPESVPICHVQQIGAYGLWFAYHKRGGRLIPGTNYLHAWLNWCRVHQHKQQITQ